MSAMGSEEAWRQFGAFAAGAIVAHVEAFGEDEPMPLQTLLAAARDVGVKITGHERAEGV